MIPRSRDGRLTTGWL